MVRLTLTQYQFNVTMGVIFIYDFFMDRGKQFSTYITNSNMMGVIKIVINKTIKQIIILMTIALYGTTI